MTYLPSLTDGFRHGSSSFQRSLHRTNDGFVPLLPNYAARPAEGRRVHRELSGYGARANERVANANTTFDSRLVEKKTVVEKRASLRDSLGATFSDIPTATARFEEISRGIDALRGGDDVPAVHLRPDEAVKEDLPPRGMRFYRIHLPNRPALLTVHVNKDSGNLPQVVGSTVHAKPNAKACEYRLSNDGTLLYNHALDAEDYDGVVDRTKAVPKATNFFLCATCLAGDCSYTIKATFQRARIVLTRAEMKARNQKKRSASDAKIEELQRDAALRSEFQDKVRTIKKEHKIKGARLIRRNDLVNHRTGLQFERDIPAENKAAVSTGNLSPESRYRRMVSQAVHRCKREDDVMSFQEETSTRNATSSGFFHVPSLEPLESTLPKLPAN